MNATGAIPFSTWRGKLTRSEVDEAIDNCDFNWMCVPDDPQCKNHEEGGTMPCALHDLYEQQLARDREAMTRWTSE